MHYRILAALLLTLVLSIHLLAQSRGPGGKPSAPTGSTASTTGRPIGNPDSPSLHNPSAFFLTGKVKIEDGTVLTDEPAIQSTCKTRTRTEGYTDSKGSFSFEISSLRENELSGLAQASDSAGFGLQDKTGNLVDRWRDCQLQAILPGFTSDVVEVAPHLLDMGNADVGTIVLHRQSQVEGFTISATTDAAPSKAKKEYDKGRELEKKQKWEQAVEKFKKAVEVYPKYAVAWLEMGRAQEQNNDTAGARQSFRQALAADSKFVSPYRELAKLAVHDRQWQEVADNTSQVLKLNPVNFPQDWFFNASANFYLKHFDVAEQSALKGLQVDTQHAVPQLEHLLGVILIQKNDYRSALEHIRKYLALAPHASDADLAQKQAQELERITAQAHSN